MTARAISRRIGHSRVAAGVTALLAAVVVALMPLPPGGAAHAADTGTTEDSAVTKSGAPGKYDDFSNLKVTVHQTKNLRTQGVRVTWSGGVPTDAFSNANFLQIMQCWGNEESGPAREQCEFGGVTSTSTKAGQYFNSREIGRDPGETEYVPGPDQASPFVPFQPANGGPPTKDNNDYTYFSPLDTNEAIYLRTGADGTGETVFQLLTVVEADHLGCGAATSDGHGRSCWLVVIPRGAHDADGAPITMNQRFDSSPLSATNWASRIVFKLDFQPIGKSCPMGQPEMPTVGSESITDAMTSWQPTLCSSTDATFSFNQSGEDYARRQVTGAPADPMLSFTVEPAKPEEGGSADLVYAPVAVSGVAVAFLIENPKGALIHELRLTPRLLAKMLTGSYILDTAHDVRDPQYLQGNPKHWRLDPELLAVNPQLADWIGQSITPESLIVALEDSDVTRMVWHWLQSDKEAQEFLAGTPDPWGTKINPYYKDLHLDTDTELAGFPKADPFSRLANPQYPDSTIGITDVQPYANDMHDAAVHTLRGDSGRKTFWEPGSPGKLTNAGGELIGERAQIAIVDTASAARYGLDTAALRNSDGNFVQPTTEALLHGVDSMKNSGVAGVLAPDPGAAKAEAYPLTAVTYTMASTGMSASDRASYAKLIRYAAGDGQTSGLAPGQLPAGYAQLPGKLRQAAAVAADLLESGKPSDGHTSDGAVTGGGAPGDAAGAAGDSGAGGIGAAGAGSSGGSNATEPEGQAGSQDVPDSKQENVAQSGGFTPSQVLGVIRWVLLSALVVGGVAALGGPLLTRFSRYRENDLS